MSLSTSSQTGSIGVEEFQRLKVLMPSEIQNRVMVTASGGDNPSLIKIRRDGTERLVIEIVLDDWQCLEQSQRDLLFWHHVFRIQNNTIPSSNWEAMVMKGGILLSLTELMMQNLVVFAIALLLIGFSAHQLYQNNRGEQALKAMTAGDQGALNLAIENGYSFESAYAGLKAAIKYLASHAPSRRQRQQQQVRLKVLEICAERHQKSPIKNQNQPVLLETTQNSPFNSGSNHSILASQSWR